MFTDLRSDTFTRPDEAMLDTMRRAKVGDDVFGEDPSVNKLESCLSDYFGMEAALFCPSGTMANQIAIKCHTQPGNEIICDKLSHVYIYEGGGIAFNSGCQVKALEGDRGRINAEQVKESINNNDIHKPETTLVSVENTANRGGGSCYDFNELETIASVCRSHDIKFHLDGARLWNALVAKNDSAKKYGDIFDSISVCLSKGLGAPVGSVLLGDVDYIKKARRIRKVFGGGMRQAGFLAAAGIHAFENNIQRLSEDHKHASDIGAALMKKDFVGKILPIETNMIIFEVRGSHTANSFADYMKQHQILCIPISPSQIRMVTHLDVNTTMVKHLISIIEKM